MAYLALMVIYRAPDNKLYELSGDVDRASLMYQFFMAIPESDGDDPFGAYLMDPDDLTVLDSKRVSEELILGVIPGTTIDELIAGGSEIELTFGEEESGLE